MLEGILRGRDFVLYKEEVISVPLKQKKKIV